MSALIWMEISNFLTWNVVINRSMIYKPQKDWQLDWIKLYKSAFEEWKKCLLNLSHADPVKEKFLVKIKKLFDHNLTFQNKDSLVLVKSGDVFIGMYFRRAYVKEYHSNLSSKTSKSLIPKDHATYHAFHRR